MSIDFETKNKLIHLANEFEVLSFTEQDPSQFLNWYKNQKDTEIACFIAALLSFGNRKQFIPKIKTIFELADKNGKMYNWIKNGFYKQDFINFAYKTQILQNSIKDEKSNFINLPNLEKKFYRFYSYKDFLDLFDSLKKILNDENSVFENSNKNEQTFGDFIKNQYQKTKKHPAQIICENFKDCKIVPQAKNSANKRIHMYLRWMIRQNSCVDLGIWTWFNQKDLIIPLDTHVLQQSIKLGLIPENSKGNLKTAIQITEQLKQIWQDDPCKGDFALFGLGINS